MRFVLGLYGDTEKAMHVLKVKKNQLLVSVSACEELNRSLNVHTRVARTTEGTLATLGGLVCGFVCPSHGQNQKHMA